MARSWRRTKHSLASPLLVLYEFVYAPCIRFVYGLPARLYVLPIYLFWNKISLTFFFHLVCVSLLLLELLKCYFDIFLSSRPSTGLTTSYITWVWLRSDRLMCRTHTDTLEYCESSFESCVMNTALVFPGGILHLSAQRDSWSPNLSSWRNVLLGQFPAPVSLGISINIK